MTDDHKAIQNVEVEQDTSRIHPVVTMMREALAANPSPETLRELLRVQQEWEANEAKRAYTHALVGLRRDLPAVIDRDQTVAFGRTRYTHTSLAQVMEAVTDILSDHDFSLSWEPKTEDRLVTVTCRLTHQEGHSEECSISSPPDNSGSKSPAQAVASTITLLQRYTVLSLLGIATADMKEDKDDDVIDAEVAESVDPARNLKAVAWLKSKGKPIDHAEQLVNKPRDEWTASDLDVIREWGNE